MVPSVQPLLFNTDFTPQQEATLGVESGINRFLLNPLNEAVKQRREEEKNIELFLQKTIESADARFQNEIMQEALNTRNLLKDRSKGSWNSPQARSARTEATMKLGALASKANQLAKYAQEGLVGIDSRTNYLKDAAKADVARIMSQSLNKIQKKDLDEVFIGDRFTDWQAKANEALNLHYGPATNSTKTINTSQGGINIAGHYEFKNNYRQKTSSDAISATLGGEHVKDGLVYNSRTGEPVFINVFDTDDASVESVILKMSEGRIDENTNKPVAYKWLEDLLAQTDKATFDATEGRDQERHKAILNTFRKFAKESEVKPTYKIDRVLGEPADPFKLAAFRADLASGNQSDRFDFNNKVEAFGAALNGAVAGDLTILTSIAKSSNKVKGLEFIGWAKDNTDNIFTKIGDNSQRAQSLNDILRTTLPDERNRLFNSNGTPTSEFFSKYQPFKGIYLKIKAQGATGATYKSFPITNYQNGNNSEELQSAIQALIDLFWDKGDMPPGASSRTGTPGSSGTSAPFSGRRPRGQ